MIILLMKYILFIDLLLLGALSSELTHLDSLLDKEKGIIIDSVTGTIYKSKR